MRRGKVVPPPCVLSSYQCNLLSGRVSDLHQAMLAAHPALSLPLISRLQFTRFHRPAQLHSCCAAYTIIMGEDLRDFQKVAVDAAKAAGAIIEAAFHQVSVAWISSAWQAWVPHMAMNADAENIWLTPTAHCQCLVQIVGY